MVANTPASEHPSSSAYRHDHTAGIKLPAEAM
jgi:hypothetical protein